MSLTEEEKTAIERCAMFSGAANTTKAADAYHAFLRRTGKRDYTSPHENFMSEVVSKCPDLGLRARYREEVCDLALTIAKEEQE